MRFTSGIGHDPDEPITGGHVRSLGLSGRNGTPHGSHHKDEHFHHKSFGRKIFSEERQKPDSDFVGTQQLVTRPISSDEPRTFGVICNPAEFDQVMEVPLSMISTKKYGTNIAVDLTEPNGQPIIIPGAEILLQRAFDDTIPWILVTVFSARLIPSD